MWERVLRRLPVSIFLLKPESRATDIFARLIRRDLAIARGAAEAAHSLSRSDRNPARELKWEEIFLFGFAVTN
jgi:hypothetical protein